MRTQQEIEHAIDALSGHSDEVAPFSVPNRYSAIEALKWVVGDNQQTWVRTNKSEVK